MSSQTQLQIRTQESQEQEFPEWVTLLFYTRHTCSGRSGRKEFNIVINEKTLEVKPAWDIYPVMFKEYGSRCSGKVEKWTTEKFIKEKMGEGWTIIKHVDYHWHAGRNDVEVEYYHLSSRTLLDYEKDYDGEYFDRVKLPDGRILKVYKNRVEVEE